MTITTTRGAAAQRQHLPGTLRFLPGLLLSTSPLCACAKPMLLLPGSLMRGIVLCTP